MNPTQIAPTELQLLDLAYYTQFPISRDELVKIATRKHCSPATLRFLRQFDAKDQFENGVDFVNRCEEIELFEHEYEAAPSEYLRSPQG